ncbi:MAG TPA: response regulator [Bryobacteraceae bacterium]|nr:response regulator [Bryobacteraceae bacterium]
MADDSPHAQRMGERILREEGFEVVTVTDGETALIRLPDVDPDLIMADVFLPQHSGYDVCKYVKNHPKHKHARVVLLAGLLEPVDEAEAGRVKADAILKKPLEASAVLATVRPLIEAARAEREAIRDAAASAPPAPAISAQEPASAAPPKQEPVPAGQLKQEPVAAGQPKQESVAAGQPEGIDRERVRAAVTIALDQAMPAMIDEITARVLTALDK